MSGPKCRAWFSSREIIALIQPVLEALQTLSDAGLVHRDVKPENILFFNGQPCLARHQPARCGRVGHHPSRHAGIRHALLVCRRTPGHVWRRGHVVHPADRKPARPDGARGLPLAAAGRGIVIGRRAVGVETPACRDPPGHRGEAWRSASWTSGRWPGALRSAPAHRGPALNPVRAVARIQPPRNPNVADIGARVGFWSFAWVGCWLVGAVGELSRSGACPGPSAPTPAASSPTAPPQPPTHHLRAEPVRNCETPRCLPTAHSPLPKANFYNPDNPDDPPDEDFMTPDENDLYQDMLVNIQNYVGDGDRSGFPAALQVARCVLGRGARVKKRPNVQLARLLLEQCADGRTIQPGSGRRPLLPCVGER